MSFDQDKSLIVKPVTTVKLSTLHWYNLVLRPMFFSSAVPPGSGAFQMPTRSSASTLRGGMANLRNTSVTFSLFCHEASLG